jgi:leader peptidase (prepilin peptidase)/N-methyltransferase
MIVASVAALLGLVVGSFLNVVIHRLPRMLQREWRRECREFLDLEPAAEPAEAFNLVVPRSRCPSCGKLITALENIPVLSYLLLRGRCRGCGARISWRYPAVEVLTAVFSVAVVAKFGFSTQAAAALPLTWALVALAFIDLDHQLLPDSITLPLVWAGLLLSLVEVFVDSPTSIAGAAAGYLTLWSVFHLFRLLTGKEGMGHGDFKLLAVFGAWLGWAKLPAIVILASVTGAAVGLGMIAFLRHDSRAPIPFGPYLAIAGWIALLWGSEINAVYWAMAAP